MVGVGWQVWEGRGHGSGQLKLTCVRKKEKCVCPRQNCTCHLLRSGETPWEGRTAQLGLMQEGRQVSSHLTLDQSPPALRLHLFFLPFGNEVAGPGAVVMGG